MNVHGVNVNVSVNVNVNVHGFEADRGHTCCMRSASGMICRLCMCDGAGMCSLECWEPRTYRQHRLATLDRPAYQVLFGREMYIAGAQ